MDKSKMEILLRNRIEKLKNEMIMTASISGMDSSETLHCSQELDKLIILYMKHFAYKKSA
ncbi:aspartyl-phosphate phosphatase Spo0E family protein [Halalkalibacter kiskunsagensis]|uniref:Aspartyl-phosphate phosphatase Spo0E family protein n=1 Tax=Halalkalibacter kiskunsagensis TaxID=1548599 RepID=A0ABV6KEQ3_9BACI